MTLPRSILVELDKEATQINVESCDVCFRDGAEWLFTHLCQMAEGEFDEKEI